MNQPIDYTAVLADLEAKREELDAAIRAVRRFMGQRGDEGPTQPRKSDSGSPSPLPPPSSAMPIIPSDAFFGMTAVDAAKKYLRMVRRPQSNKAIAAALQRSGYKTQAKNFYANLYTSLARDSEVEKIERGVWGLSEWYPGKSRSRKAKEENGPQDESPLEHRSEG